MALLCALTTQVFAQDDFGFGFGDAGGAPLGGSGGGSTGGSFITGASVGGTVSAGLQFFLDDAEDLDTLKAATLSDIFSGALNFKASGSNADGVISLKLSPNFADPTQIVSLDEAYIRAFYGDFNIEGGLRKLSWGKADTLGPLDVINPLDYTDLSSMSDPQAIKMARPLIHASYGIGNFSKIEGVFVPWFEGARFSQEGRWAPAQVGNFSDDLEALIRSNLTVAINAAMAQSGAKFETPAIDQSKLVPDTATLEYLQGGIRFTTTVGPVDFGIQYYNGYLSRPAAAVNKGGYAAAQKAIADLDTALVAVGIKNADFVLRKADFEAAQSAAEAAALQATGAASASAALQASATAALSAASGNPSDPLYQALTAAAAGAALADTTAQAALAAAITDATTKGGTYATAGADLQTAADAAAAAQGAVQAALTPEKLVSVAYNRYHHIGLDYAQVLLGFNVRAELAANLTADFAGDDGLVYNPAIAWSFGFDRDIPVVGINANLQVNESVRLFNDKVGDDPLFDIEAGTSVTSTRLTASLSRSFFRNELELRATAIWGIEDKDCYIIPALTWTRGDVALEVSAGIFAGDRDGELGQYRDNGFVKTALSYSF
jgi:hypothetical protein